MNCFKTRKTDPNTKELWKLDKLRAFVAIAEAKTFTAGAKLVHVTQAAISMQIRQLEDELGLQLFTRTPRRVILTEAVKCARSCEKDSSRNMMRELRKLPNLLVPNTADCV